MRFEVARDPLHPAMNSGVVAVKTSGVIFEERVGEKVPGRAVEPRVKVERTLPSPDVERRGDHPPTRSIDARVRGPGRGGRPTALRL